MNRIYISRQSWWFGVALWCGAVVMALGAMFLFSVMFLLSLVLLPVAALVFWLYYRRFYRVTSMGFIVPTWTVRREREVRDIREIIGADARDSRSAMLTPEEKEAFLQALAEADEGKDIDEDGARRE